MSSSADLFYYNVVINNPGPGSIQANYSEQRDIPLLKDPSEYYMSIIRFSVPGFSIPLLIVPVTNFPSVPSQTPYFITLQYNGFTVRQNVLYFSRTFIQGSLDQPNSEYFFIYTYQHLIDLFNNAFSLAMTALNALASTSFNAPYLIYNAQTQLISLITDYTGFVTPSTAYDQSFAVPPANTVNIYINQESFNFFQGMNFIFRNNFSGSIDPFWLLVEETFNNYYPTPYPKGTQTQLIQTQQFNSLNNWNSFNSLAFISKSLPILKEFTPNVGFQNNVNTTQASSNTLPIITDFVPLLQFAGDQRSDYIYNANSLYRLIEMQNKDPLYSIDLQVAWIDQYNNQYPISLEPGQSINIKFMFVKKSLYRQNKLMSAF